jgi:hypothetical protein
MERTTRSAKLPVISEPLQPPKVSAHTSFRSFDYCNDDFNSSGEDERKNLKFKILKQPSLNLLSLYLGGAQEEEVN